MSDHTQYCHSRELTQDEWFELYQKTKQERDEAREALKYIAHSGLSTRFIEGFAREFLKRKEAAK